MLKGVFTALVTPFNNDGSIDEEAFKELLKYQIVNGINGLVPVGTTGESPTLTTKEKELIIKLTVDAAGDKIPVIAGSGSNNTNAAIEATKAAKDLGADMTLQVAPYYNKPTEEGLYRHFSEIAEKGGLPVVLYNVPGRSGINMSVSLILKLAKNPAIVAVKEASGNISQILELTNKKPEGFSILSGDDALTLPLMAAGGDGIISVASNAFPKEMVELTQNLLTGNIEKAREIHNKFLPFFFNQFIESNPVPIKTFMAEKGMMKATFRMPLCEMKDSTKEILFSTFS